MKNRRRGCSASTPGRAVNVVAQLVANKEESIYIVVIGECEETAVANNGLLICIQY
jgi:hypothetical protein